MLLTNLKQKFIPLALVGLFPFAVQAHHGASAHFDLNTELKIEGVLTDFQMVNPHGFVYFNGVSENGALEPWRCEMGTNLSREATQETLLPGGKVLVTGNPARREDNLCKIELIEHEDGRTIDFSGRATAGATDYQPSEQLIALSGDFIGDDLGQAENDVIAVGDSAAANRRIVDVPTEGFFGHWNADGHGFLGVAGIGRNTTPEPITSDLPLPTAFQQPSYTSDGLALVEAFDARFDYPALQCESSVFDGIFHHGNINEFVQESDDTIRWVYGYMDVLRNIHLNQTEHPSTLEPTLTGYSIGRWEEDSLVVETKGFSRQWLYQISGRDRLLDGQVVSSEELSLRERITHDVENDQLVVEYWAQDPVFWEDSVSGVYRLSRSDTA